MIITCDDDHGFDEDVESDNDQDYDEFDNEQIIIS